MTKRVFLSFAEEDAQKVEKIIPLFRSPNYELDFYEGDLSLDFGAEGAQALRMAMGEKIAKCNIVVCLIGENTHKSRWVDCQLRKNRDKGNKIIAMALKGVECVVLPIVVKEESLNFYPWDPQKLKTLITADTRKLFNNST
ncbi:MAG: TIR domain-containing protein [Candidatus Omnitrophica bacterium]|nr:TIR domain-containing protein [Candidatus Omnitrophota bacterium]MBU1922921.1 TIR domain-containing protein [Candidatus Omnitrophota bacterium]